MWSDAEGHDVVHKFLRWSLSDNYNQEMNDNDIADQLRLVYRCLRFMRNTKWWWCEFLFIWETTLVNAYNFFWARRLSGRTRSFRRASPGRCWTRPDRRGGRTRARRRYGSGPGRGTLVNARSRRNRCGSVADTASVSTRRRSTFPWLCLPRKRGQRGASCTAWPTTRPSTGQHKTRRGCGIPCGSVRTATRGCALLAGGNFTRRRSSGLTITARF